MSMERVTHAIHAGLFGTWAKDNKLIALAEKWGVQCSYLRWLPRMVWLHMTEGDLTSEDVKFTLGGNLDKKANWNNI